MIYRLNNSLSIIEYVLCICTIVQFFFFRYIFDNDYSDTDFDDDLITSVENNCSDSDFDESFTAVEMPDE